MMHPRRANALLLSWLCRGVSTFEITRSSSVYWSGSSSPLRHQRVRQRVVNSLPSFGFYWESAACRNNNYRRRFFSTNNQHPSSPSPSHGLDLAEQAFNVLANRKKTWQRLRHLVFLAQDLQTMTPTWRSIVDVGTDHGILPLALAATGQFETVWGVDASEQALENGAKTLHAEAQSQLNKTAESSDGAPLFSSVEFLLGNGLTALPDDTINVDIVCIAGMGRESMIQILKPAQLDRLACRALLLQPTNSKPKHLMELYDTLYIMGWKLQDERIEYQSGRWYLSVAFVRSLERSTSPDNMNETPLPGSILHSRRLLSLEDTTTTYFPDYVQHHVRWLQNDLKKRGTLNENESRWLQMFGPG